MKIRLKRKEAVKKYICKMVVSIVFIYTGSNKLLNLKGGGKYFVTSRHQRYWCTHPR